MRSLKLLVLLGCTALMSACLDFDFSGAERIASFHPLTSSAEEKIFEQELLGTWGLV